MNLVDSCVTLHTNHEPSNQNGITRIKVFSVKIFILLKNFRFIKTNSILMAKLCRHTHTHTHTQSIHSFITTQMSCWFSHTHRNIGCWAENNDIGRYHRINVIGSFPPSHTRNSHLSIAPLFIHGLSSQSIPKHHWLHIRNSHAVTLTYYC